MIKVWGVDIEPENWPKAREPVQIPPLLRARDLVWTPEQIEAVTEMDLAEILWPNDREGSQCMND